MRETEEAQAKKLDAADELKAFRQRFHLPHGVYLCGHSLGLQPKATAAILEAELDAWADRAVDAHFEGDAPWYSYHELCRDSGARLVGAEPGEVVMMNSLSVNLHLMLVSFYRPTKERHAILMEDCAFPSDTYAAQSQLRYHGHDPKEGVLVAKPREGEATLRTEDLETFLETRGQEIAVVLLGAVNYFTGQLFALDRIVKAAHRQGCIVGLDLAHAAGNVPLRLHDWDVDFAVWCSYKYLNSGPGAVAGCFVHERHGKDKGLPRFAGWWGNDPRRRFRMHLEGEFEPVEGADGWQVSNPPILALAPLRASLALFDEAGYERLRQKSLELTAYLESWIDQAGQDRIELLTPRDANQRGCQLSLRVLREPRTLVKALADAGIVVDFREPDVVRVAPVPLYNSFHDVWRFGRILTDWAART